MRCPKCPDAVLVMTERQSVEIDYCPLCRGVWLDRGELDKLIERSAMAESGSGRAQVHSNTPANTAANGQRHRDHDDFSDSDYRSGRKQYGSRKKSWLGEIFD
jgi:uncharacterized protein